MAKRKMWTNDEWSGRIYYCDEDDAGMFWAHDVEHLRHRRGPCVTWVFLRTGHKIVVQCPLAEAMAAIGVPESELDPPDPENNQKTGDQNGPSRD